jgi:hypothetical protein
MNERVAVRIGGNNHRHPSNQWSILTTYSNWTTVAGQPQAGRRPPKRRTNTPNIGHPADEAPLTSHFH